MSESIRNYLTVLFLSSVVFIVLFWAMGCSNAAKRTFDIDYVGGDLELISIVVGAQEHNSEDVIVGIDPNLKGIDLPNLTFEGSASWGWHSFRIKEVSGSVLIKRFGDEVQVNDLPEMLKSVSNPFIERKEK